jgi:trans-2-enoyl-CoA reductase
LSERKASHVCANRLNATDNFMTGDDWQRWVREFAVDDVEVGAANAAGEDAQTQVVGAGLGKCSLFERKRRVRAM